MARSYWDIQYYDTGSGGFWVTDTKIPRGGLEPMERVREANLQFVRLVDGSKAKLSSEVKTNWQTITLLFPKQVVTETVKNQFLDYIDNERGIRIPIPIITGAASYTEKVIEGYISKYSEEWVLDGNSQQQFVVKLDIEEFDVDGA